MKKFVDVEALNLRSEPEISPENRMAVLHLGQPVDVVDEAGNGWLRIDVNQVGQPTLNGFVKQQIGAQPSTGFLPKASLREPVSAGREALVEQAIKEWVRFRRGQGRENVDPFFRYIGDMWAAIGQNLDGKDTDIPWSAAAISFMVRNASQSAVKYKNFKFASAHSRYIHDAILKNKAQSQDAPFWGKQIFDGIPQVGDIVGKWRESPRTFEDAEHSDSFKSHTDVVVSVSPDFVLAIGGNVSNSVGLSRYDKEPSGHLANSGGVIVLMENRT